VHANVLGDVPATLFDDDEVLISTEVGSGENRRGAG